MTFQISEQARFVYCQLCWIFFFEPRSFFSLFPRDENDTDIFPTVFETEFVQRGSNLSISESEYSTSDTVSVSKYLNRMFMMSTSNLSYSTWLTLSVFESESDQKCKKTNIISVIIVCIRSVFIPISHPQCIRNTADGWIEPRGPSARPLASCCWPNEHTLVPTNCVELNIT